MERQIRENDEEFGVNRWEVLKSYACVREIAYTDQIDNNKKTTQ